MSIEFFTHLKCDNREAVKAVAKEIGYEGNVVQVWWRDNEYSVSTRRGLPHDKVTKISKKFPDDIITCRYSNSYYDYSEFRTVEYRAGHAGKGNLEPAYVHVRDNKYPLTGYRDQDVMSKIIESFFRGFDTVETDKDGKQFIKWRTEKLTYEFDYDAADGKRYRIAATKMGHRIGSKLMGVRKALSKPNDSQAWD